MVVVAVVVAVAAAAAVVMVMVMVVVMVMVIVMVMVVVVCDDYGTKAVGSGSGSFTSELNFFFADELAQRERTAGWHVQGERRQGDRVGRQAMGEEGRRGGS